MTKPLPMLTAERARELLAYDPETGILTWKITRPGAPAGAVVGTKTPEGYIQIEVEYRLYRAHRVIWLMQTGRWPEHNVDHRNRVRDDNRWENLREATPLQNSWNRGKCSRNTSGKVGVHPINDLLWGAEIGVNGRNIKLGRFTCKEEAIAARCEAERHYFGDFAAQVSNVRKHPKGDAR